MKVTVYLVKIFILKHNGIVKIEELEFDTQKEATKYAKRREKGCARAKTYKDYFVSLYPALRVKENT